MSEPCPGCKQRPCVCVTISLPKENTPGWWDDRDVWHNGWAVTHTMGHHPENGPPFCQECTEAFGNWVKWPCEQRAYDEKHHDPGTRCDGCHSFGFEEGVQAARDAVAAVPHDTFCVTRDDNYQRPCNCPVDDALAAIDALRGKA